MMQICLHQEGKTSEVRSMVPGDWRDGGRPKRIACRANAEAGKWLTSLRTHGQGHSRNCICIRIKCHLLMTIGAHAGYYLHGGGAGLEQVAPPNIACPAC